MLGRATIASSASLIAIATLLGTPWGAVKSLAQSSAQSPASAAQGSACPGDNGGITLPPGFCATVFADNLGHVRHMAVAPNGVLYVNTWSGRYFHNDTPPAGGFLIALRDSKDTGQADKIERFGAGVPQGSAGGSGIAIYNGAVYAEQNDKIIRYALSSDSIVPNTAPIAIVSGLPLTGDHPMHPFIIDAQGHIYVDLGSATNSCQTENRMPNSPGHDPCTELQTRAGTWLYDANKSGQEFSPTERYVTGLRNGEGFGIDSSGRLFATQHGRDQLAQNFAKLYTPKQSAEEPAEELVLEQKGADYGWPECYYDNEQKKLVLAPEYGGDGGHKIGVCADKTAPVASFPGHWAPNDLLIYTGTTFPSAYHDGAFIAFHGSWNRAPEPQGGYNVVFQPLKDGKAAGDFIVFADGFAGKIKEPGQAAFRPTGLAMSPDGALYISDDKHGRIWRVTYHGAADAALAPAPAVVATSEGNPQPPEGTHPDAGRTSSAALPVPPGATKEQVALGDRIFHGEAASGTCSGCHGSDAKGGPQAPSLVKGRWLIGDGSLKSLAETITNGVPRPHNYEVPMPPKGGAPLSDSDVNAVAAYVWAVNQARGGT
ncbi:MAG TPA: PQQ-dependent sugar dehydrogenase [Xanthobacteraceae bacterium]|nr:PQQ-dependent sugar dehydrogenase [Xanthobacteraceae bacterium]